MEFRKGKWIRQSKAAAILLLAGAMLLAVYGSFAAYTSFNSVKRVVATGARSDIMFGSNYLSLLNLNDGNYPVKRISLAENGGTCSFTVLVCNYVWGDESLYNPKEINYTVTMKLFSMDGGDLPSDVTAIKVNNQGFDNGGNCILSSQKLSSGQAQRIEYKFEIPSSLKDKVRIQIVVEPDSVSQEAVNSQKLAAVLSFAEYEANKNWTGHFLDSQDRTPDDYDAFNYEISGNGAGTVTVTWQDSLQLSKWVTSGKQVSSSCSYSFDVDDSTTAIQFQFYRNPEKLSELKGIKWTDLENLVEVTFIEKVDENENTQK